MSETTKVIVTKTKLDALANSINDKAGSTGKKTIDQMKDMVDNMDTLVTLPVWEGGDY